MLPLARLRRILWGLLLGPLGTAAIALVPRAVSGAAQWILALRAGSAAVTPYVTTTLRGSAAISILAAALPPLIAERRSALRYRSGRRVLTGALLILGVLAGLLTFAFESTVGIGWRRGSYCSVFATVTLFQAGALGIWPYWQLNERHITVFLQSTVFFAFCIGFAWFGLGELAAIAGSLAAGFPLFVLIGPCSLRRAGRYAVVLARRAIPLSIVSTATAAVFPIAMSRGESTLGASVAGNQMLFWSCALPLTFVSQAVAARVLTTDRQQPNPAALRDWSRLSIPLVAVALVVFAGFRWVVPRYVHGLSAAGAPFVLFVAATSFILSDPLCFFFCPISDRHHVARGSVAVAVAMSAILILRPQLVAQMSVVGPSGIIGALRLLFIRAPALRTVRTVLLLVLLIGYGVAIWFH